jgi:hypothetical protein
MTASATGRNLASLQRGTQRNATSSMRTAARSAAVNTVPMRIRLVRLEIEEREAIQIRSGDNVYFRVTLPHAYRTFLGERQLLCVVTPHP